MNNEVKLGIAKLLHYYCSGYWACTAQIHVKPSIRRPKGDTRPKSPRIHSKGPQHQSSDPHEIRSISISILYGFATQDLDHIYTDLVRIYLLNNRSHDGYMKGKSALPQMKKEFPTMILLAMNSARTHSQINNKLISTSTQPLTVAKNRRDETLRQKEPKTTN
ncbi:hypothetical protein PIB30_035069 [Stylosanthes scabra]|uniref:Uncharacterized protein n=1 Tax=Stylosanthes scabra TaxID=79078 RepID=A0ABU6Z9V4_9FABA|nr:hypothetical protein [Stylosanthes scabra]